MRAPIALLAAVLLAGAACIAPAEAATQLKFGHVGEPGSLFEASVNEGWTVDGADGFVYTVDWEGRPVVRERGVFLSGKCDQDKRHAPYRPIAHAFRELILDLLAESDEQIALWRERFGTVPVTPATSW